MIKENFKQSKYKLREEWAGKTSSIVLWTMLFLMSGISIVGATSHTSQNYQIPADVFSGGGSASSSPSYINQSKIGQEGVVGSPSTSASGQQANHGFWPMVIPYDPAESLNNLKDMVLLPKVAETTICSIVD